MKVADQEPAPSIAAPSIEDLERIFEQAQARLNAAKIAYLNGTELDGRAVTYEIVKQAAQDSIAANYAIQKARYGSIKLKLSVAKLLRRGR